MTRHICLHGAESTGKSTLAPRLAARLGGVVVPEYGRAYAEANSTEFGEVDLLAIFDGHVAATRDAMAQNPEWLMRSEEHTSELQSLMRISYAVFCLKKKKNNKKQNTKRNNN